MRKEKLHTAVEKFWRRHVGRPCRVCVAVSGGSDSTALFHLLFELKERLALLNIGIAHVNHRLRPGESDEDAAFVKNIAARFGVPFHQKTLRAKDIPGHGIEEWARNDAVCFFPACQKIERDMITSRPPTPRMTRRKPCFCVACAEQGWPDCAPSSLSGPTASSARCLR